MIYGQCRGSAHNVCPWITMVSILFAGSNQLFIKTTVRTATDLNKLYHLPKIAKNTKNSKDDNNIVK
jgi:hypothetical protein